MDRDAGQGSVVEDDGHDGWASPGRIVAAVGGIGAGDSPLLVWCSCYGVWAPWVALGALVRRLLCHEAGMLKKSTQITEHQAVSSKLTRPAGDLSAQDHLPVLKAPSR